MRKLESVDDIWSCSPQQDELERAAEYASKSLPWTFNRMMLNTGSPGQQRRALNIAKGRLAQEVLARELESRGLSPNLDITSYRNPDETDFGLPAPDGSLSLDIKTVNYYSDYEVDGRPEFHLEYVVENASYAGPDWRRFFPALVPHNQLGQDKDAYCFAIAESIDFRNDNVTDRQAALLCAFPYGPWLRFLSSQRLCKAREDEDKGFSVRLELDQEAQENLFDVTSIVCHVRGDWAGNHVAREVRLGGQEGSTVGPFSAVSAISIGEESLRNLDGAGLLLSVEENELTKPVRNTSRTNVNVLPEEPLSLDHDDFCNLILPGSYTLHYIGWLEKEDFLYAVENYMGWVWPDDSDNKYLNQEWSQVTERDRVVIEKAGYEDAVPDPEEQVDIGIMKTYGRGGACCYVYPNIYGGGVRENNLYVLPKDLTVMEELVEEYGT